MISATRLHQLLGLIRAGREDLFYGWPEWQTLREDVLKLDKRDVCSAGNSAAGTGRPGSSTMSSTCGTGRTWP